MRKTFPFLILLVLAVVSLAGERGAFAQNAKEAGKANTSRTGTSGRQLPRFVSLKSNRVNLRQGPSLDHAIAWEFKRAGLPVEVVNEFEHWRRVRYSDGTQGWVFHSLLSGRRTGVVTPWVKKKQSVPLFSARSTSGAVLARLEPGVLGSVLSCDGKWCNFALDTVSGWVEQVNLWGVYENEKIK